jgi:hypothetical protein
VDLDDGVVVFAHQPNLAAADCRLARKQQETAWAGPAGVVKGDG